MWAFTVIFKFAICCTLSKYKAFGWGIWKIIRSHIKYSLKSFPGRGGGYFRNFWVGCAAGTLEPSTYTRASAAKFCYPILE